MSKEIAEDVPYISFMVQYLQRHRKILKQQREFRDYIEFHHKEKKKAVISFTEWQLNFIKNVYKYIN